MITNSLPIQMTCEYPGCKCNKGFDYVRKSGDVEPGWENEPIFLCEEHSKGYNLYILKNIKNE